MTPIAWKALIVVIAMLAAVGLAVILLLNPMNATDATKGVLDVVLGFLGGVIALGSQAIFSHVAGNPTIAPQGQGVTK